MLPHPDGVEPEGNLLLGGQAAAVASHATRRSGLGRLAQLDDAILLKILSQATPAVLGTLCAVSDVLSAFASFEEHWRVACAEHIAGAPAIFSGSWKRTFQIMRGRSSDNKPLAQASRTRGVSVFSDALYLPFQLTHGPNHFGSSPRGPPVARLTHTEREPDLAGFAAEFEAGKGKPVVIEGAPAGAIGAHSRSWDEAELRSKLGERIFHAGGVNFKLSDYLDYAHSNSDDQPLYLFDPTFGATAPELLDEYQPPVYFRNDLFSLLDGAAAEGPDGDRARPSRPDYRWLLIGGRRSGQSWHKDPNMTSAWNLTLRGRKRWLFFPPHVTPPGVFPTASDGGRPGEAHDYVTPIALAEWARDFYDEACRTPGFVETESGPGDVTFVPRGWWHMVLNVAPLTVAVSHHFLSPAGLHTTLRLLRETPWQVSGIDRGLTRDKSDGTAAATEREAEDHARRTAAGVALLDHLVTTLRERQPEALDAAERRVSEEDERRAPRGPTGLKKLVAPIEAPASFSFSFG